MALKTLLLIVSLFGSIVQAQDTLQVFTGAQELELEMLSDRMKLEIAAKTGESHIIRLTAASQSAVAQEGVSLNIDCSPWLEQYPGGSIRWTVIQLNEDGDPVNPNAPPEVLMRNELVDPPPRIIVGGDHNRWLNITRTVIVQGAEDPDRKIFTCEVCVARGTPFEQCHSTNYTSQLIGAPPVITDESANICRSPGEFAMLQCGISGDQPLPLPTPMRFWFRNGIQISSGLLEQPQDATEFIMNNTLLELGVLDPQVFVVTMDGDINFQTDVVNISIPSMIPEIATVAEAEMILFQLLQGVWTCVAENDLGRTSITYTIRQCGPVPVIPDCRSSFLNGVVFPDSGDTLSPGCSVCIQRGSFVTLDCTVSAGEPPISYNWRDGMNTVISRNARLTVREPGNYSCTASNLDDRFMTRASVLFYSPRAEIKTAIVGRPTNGCERLRLNDTQRANFQAVNTCIFFEEILSVNCTSSDPMAELVLTSSDGRQYENGSATIVVTDVNANEVDTTFICRISNAEGPCGTAEFRSTVRVFDPAKISRMVALGGDFGAGRSPDVIQQDNGTTVTLRCPTSGRTAETTMWRRVIENSDGCLVEVDIDDLEEAQRSRHTETFGTVSGFNDAILTISPFTHADEGTYVCRTENIAGEDADVVSLIVDPGSPTYTTTSFGQCNINCSDGVRNRSVVCRNDRDMLVIPEFRCEEIPSLMRPPSSESCRETFPVVCLLDPVWVPYQWSACTGGCKGGYRRRDVLCQVPMTGETKQDHFCHHLVKPPSFEFCPMTCCERDNFPTFCKLVGTSRCNELVYRQYCCWTCGLRDIP